MLRSTPWSRAICRIILRFTVSFICGISSVFAPQVTRDSTIFVYSLPALTIASRHVLYSVSLSSSFGSFFKSSFMRRREQFPLPVLFLRVSFVFVSFSAGFVSAIFW